MSTTILLGLLSIGILIFVHELGHFLMARVAGIRVEVFSIGWGKSVVSFMWKGTKIQLGWIPFGGYCKMAGDSPKDSTSGSPDEYYSSPPLGRIVVALGGPVFNYLFAAILLSLVVLIGYQVRTYSNRIILAKSVETVGTAKRTPAQTSGLRDGDVIVEIGGKPISNWDDITENIVRNALRPISIKVARDGAPVALSVVPELDRETGRGVIGIHPWVEPVVGEVQNGEPAEAAGLKPGDRILSVDGVKIGNHVDFYNAIQGKSGKAVPFAVDRGGKNLELYLIPRLVEGNDSAGLYFEQITYHSVRYPFPVSVWKGIVKSNDGVRDTVRGVLLLVGGKIRARSAVAGPAKLIYLSGMIAKEGFIYFLQVMSYISIAFFIMNLIPFPALDGSHLIIAVYEIFARKKPNLEVVQKIQTLGFIVLIAALALVTMNDIRGFFLK
jgi:regulator of sigma E protease